MTNTPAGHPDESRYSDRRASMSSIASNARFTLGSYFNANADGQPSGDRNARLAGTRKAFAVNIGVADGVPVSIRAKGEGKGQEGAYAFAKLAQLVNAAAAAKRMPDIEARMEEERLDIRIINPATGEINTNAGTAPYQTLKRVDVVLKQVVETIGGLYPVN